MTVAAVVAFTPGALAHFLLPPALPPHRIVPPLCEDVALREVHRVIRARVATLTREPEGLAAAERAMRARAMRLGFTPVRTSQFAP